MHSNMILSIAELRESYVNVHLEKDPHATADELTQEFNRSVLLYLSVEFEKLGDFLYGNATVMRESSPTLSEYLSFSSGIAQGASERFRNFSIETIASLPDRYE